MSVDNYTFGINLSALATSINLVARALDRQAEAEQRKATACLELNEKLDDILAFGLMYLQARWGKACNVVDEWGQIREVLKNRKLLIPSLTSQPSRKKI